MYCVVSISFFVFAYSVMQSVKSLTQVLQVQQWPEVELPPPLSQATKTKVAILWQQAKFNGPFRNYINQIIDQLYVSPALWSTISQKRQDKLHSYQKNVFFRYGQCKTGEYLDLWGLLTGKLLIEEYQGFPTRYSTSLLLKRLQNC